MNTQEIIQEPIVDPPNVEPPKSAPGKVNGVESQEVMAKIIAYKNAYEKAVIIDALIEKYGGNPALSPGSLLL